MYYFVHVRNRNVHFFCTEDTPPETATSMEKSECLPYCFYASKVRLSLYTMDAANFKCVMITSPITVITVIIIRPHLPKLT